MYTLVQSVSETMSNIPVHIGAQVLKLTVFHMLMPKFVKWSKGYPLQINDCELRDGTPSTKFPEIRSKHPTMDRDALADGRFFKKTGKSQVLAFNQANARKATRVALFFSEDIAAQINLHRERLEFNANHERLVQSTEVCLLTFPFLLCSYINRTVYPQWILLVIINVKLLYHFHHINLVPRHS